MKIKVIGEVYDLAEGLTEVPLKGKEFEAICNPNKTLYWIFHGESTFKLQARDVAELAASEPTLQSIVTMGGQGLKAIELKFR